MIRDNVSKALLSNDAEALNKYKVERKRIRQTENLCKEVEKMKEILNNIFDRLEKIEKRM
jgi:coenzyme F420-reducing hydrogenase delta subunit